MGGHFVLISVPIISPHCPQTTLTAPSHFFILFHNFPHFSTLFHKIVGNVCRKPPLLPAWPPFPCKQHLSYNRTCSPHTHLPMSCYHAMLLPYHTISCIPNHTLHSTQTHTCQSHASTTPYQCGSMLNFLLSFACYCYWKMKCYCYCKFYVKYWSLRLHEWIARLMTLQWMISRGKWVEAHYVARN